ncbi:PspC domain-containing protein [Patescibacteria group bacterium]
MGNQAKKLYRSRTNRVISGVCGGLAEYYDIDVTIIRVVFVIFSFVQGFGILAYIILLLVVPETEGSKIPYDTEERFKGFVKDIGKKMESITKELPGEKPWIREPRNIFALAIIFIGLVALASSFFHIYWLQWHLFWPVALIILGIIFIIKMRQ